MRKTTNLVAGAIGIATFAAAAPAMAQYYPYGAPYGYGYGAPGANTQMATQQCTAAVQNRLYARNGLGGVIGSLFGTYGSSGRVVGITSVSTNGRYLHVRGVASSGAAAYGPYGVGAYGATGYAYQPDLAFSCDVDYRGYVRDVDIDRRY